MSLSLPLWGAEQMDCGGTSLSRTRKLTAGTLPAMVDHSVSAAFPAASRASCRLR
jgi:hypothetical protein